MWGYTTDDISDDLFSNADHAFLDTLDEAQARIFAAEAGYDLVDDNGMLTDWWGFCWMILAERRGGCSRAWKTALPRARRSRRSISPRRT